MIKFPEALCKHLNQIYRTFRYSCKYINKMQKMTK